MATQHSGFFSRISKNITFRLYGAIIWRYLAWLLLLNFFGFIFYTIFAVLFYQFVLSSLDILAPVILVIRYFVFHIAAFILAMESVMKVGFKSGHYKLIVENCRAQKKKS